MKRKEGGIKSDRLLLVEGKDEEAFFDKVFQHQDITGVQTRDAGGKDKFKSTFHYLSSTDGFSKVRSLGIVRDAERNPASSAFTSICSTLEKYSLPTPEAANTVIDGKNNQGRDIRIGVFIMPNNADTGMLEDLCLESARMEPVFDCVDRYMECCLSKLPEDERPRNLSKAKVQTYLAARKEITNSLGLGARKGYWDFDHVCFEGIKQFLRELFVD